ncbi:MAG: branched-chain-amino-acid transaminase [Myxococcota bacterium]
MSAGSARTGEASVWIDGGVVPLAEARIPVDDHGVLYGDGVFEGMRIFHGGVFRLERHMARIDAAARAIGLELPGGTDALREIVFETARAFGEDEAYVRLVVTRGQGALGVDPTTCPTPRVFCIVTRVAIYPEEKLASGIDLVTSSWRRPSPDVLDPRVKSLNYLNNALAKLEARRRGADEALLLNGAGQVAEASVANLFAVRDGALLTPPASDGALEGITRQTVLELAPGLGLPAHERTLGRFDLFAASEVFLCGSGAGFVPVRSLDGRTIGEGGPGPVYRRVRAAFAEAARDRVVPFRSA